MPRSRGGRVLIAFDRDEAGDRGAAKLAERLGEGVECFRVLFPAGRMRTRAASVADPAGALAELLDGGRFGPGGSPRPEPLERCCAAVARWCRRGGRASSSQAGEEQPGGRTGCCPFPAAKPPAAPVSPPGRGNRAVELAGDELRVEIEDRRWRVRGSGG